jgi:RHS repeat-associated protein
MKVIPTFIQEAREALSMVAKTCAGHYHYDIHGNVDTLLQDNAQLAFISTQLASQRFKKISYDFDLISGKVNLVSYQDGEPDAFYHFYEYDADNRITAVYTCNTPLGTGGININTVSNSPLWDNDAKYFYYAHGPLARTEYGDNKVQGQDYAYTLQGWIKGVNSNTLDTLRDIGKDGAIGSINSIFAKDAFGYTLNYHTNDYKAIDGLKWNNANNRFESIIAGSDLNNSRNDLFNGNITSMVTTIIPPTLPKSDSVVFSALPQGTAYKYDQLNRLVEMKAWQNLNTTTNTWGSGLTYNGMYHNKFSYDANGSMLTAFANNQAGDTIDNQIYHHQMVNGRKFRNRTYAITDSATITSGNDLLNQIGYTNNADSVNSFNNYSYTEIGERKGDKQDSIALITWTVYGKLDSIARVSGSRKNNLKFDYDAFQKRIAKHVYTSNSTWLYSEYYLRDAQGNLMSVYTHQIIDSTSTVSFAQTEKEIYGSNELGIDVTKTELIGTLPVSNIFIRTLDNKHYTGSNHLGNVLTTFTDRKLPIDADNNGIIDVFFPDVIASNDFMPFGAFQTERTHKKYTFPNSFNGKRDDKELNWQDYGMRMYSQMEREFPIPDPLIVNGQKYAWYSPYQFAGNKPIWKVDIDGLEEGGGSVGLEIPLRKMTFRELIRNIKVKVFGTLGIQLGEDTKATAEAEVNYSKEEGFGAKGGVELEQGVPGSNYNLETQTKPNYTIKFETEYNKDEGAKTEVSGDCETGKDYVTGENKEAHEKTDGIVGGSGQPTVKVEKPEPNSQSKDQANQTANDDAKKEFGKKTEEELKGNEGADKQPPAQQNNAAPAPAGVPSKENFKNAFLNLKLK